MLSHQRANVTGARRSVRAELLTPRLKLTAANSVQPANQRGRRSWRRALRQYSKLLFEAPAPSPLRAGEDLSANLPSPLSTPEAGPDAMRGSGAASRRTTAYGASRPLP